MRFLLSAGFTYLLFISEGLAQTDQRHPSYAVQGVEEFIDEGMSPFIGFNRPTSEILFDRQNHVTDKAAQILIKRQNDEIIDNKFLIGGRFIGTSVFEKTNTDGKFPILSRLPPAHTSDNTGTLNIVNDASINFILPLPYLTLFAQGEYTENAYPGQSRQEWRKYYAMIGDLDVFPMYLAFGKKTVSFGDMSSYAPFTHSHNSHYFWAQNDDDPLFELGYVDNGVHATASLIKNDRGNRVLNAPQGKNGYENFALNATKDFMVETDHRLRIGAGFLRGTIYDSSLAHHPPSNGFQDRDWANAYNIHGIYSTSKYDLMAEFTRTVDKWPATDSHVHALTLQGRYRDYIWQIPVTYSLMWSEGVQGEEGDEWEKMIQTVAGIEMRLHPNVSIGFEYLNNLDFVPLIRPRVTADNGVVSHTFLAGVKVTF